MQKKYIYLLLGIFFDAIGMLSYAIPGVGDFSDIIWAPVSGYIIYRMYKGTEGQVAGLVTFIEEIIPGIDIIPTFTLMWFYTFVLKKKK